MPVVVVGGDYGTTTGTVPKFQLPYLALLSSMQCQTLIVTYAQSHNVATQTNQSTCSSLQHKKGILNQLETMLLLHDYKTGQVIIDQYHYYPY